jgi:hypothetical protein
MAFGVEYFRFSFAYGNTNPFIDARASENFQVARDYAGLDRFPVCCCVIVARIVRGRRGHVNRCSCASLRKTVQKFFSVAEVFTKTFKQKTPPLVVSGGAETAKGRSY